MADGGYPNSTRANTALLIYRDAMREYIAQILKREHGPNWIHSQVLNDDARDRDESSYDKRHQSLQGGASPRDLIDPAEFPFLIRDNARAFPDLDQSDIRRMHDIRNSRNNFQHASTSGDCSPEDADRISRLCIRTLERCGLSSAVASIHALSSDVAPGAPTVSGAALRKQREQREWYKDRLAGKSPEELTPWEQERLAEIEWEEEWERRELVRSEREEIARFGDDIDRLRLWFEADEARHDRHPPKYAALRRREQERHESEQAEITARVDDIDGLRHWFDTHKARPKRHPSEYAALRRREQERHKQQEREWRERQSSLSGIGWAEQARRERERAETAALTDDIDALGPWLDADEARRDRHPAEHATLPQRGQERCERQSSLSGIGWAEQARREREQRDKERPERHSPEYTTLPQRKQERRDRQSSLSSIERAEQARREREQRNERELQEREQAEIAAFDGSIDGLRRWFNEDLNRAPRHRSIWATLRKEEQSRERDEREELERLAGDTTELLGWFDADSGRPERHKSAYEEILRREREDLVPREREEIGQFGDDLDRLRHWFDADSGRPRRHKSAHEDLLRRERELHEEERADEPSAPAKRSLRSRIFRRR